MSAPEPRRSRCPAPVRCREDAERALASSAQIIERSGGPERHKIAAVATARYRPRIMLTRLRT